MSPDAHDFLPNAGGLGEAAKQQGLQLAEQNAMKAAKSAISGKSEKAGETTAKAEQGIQLARQAAGMSGGLSGNTQLPPAGKTPSFVADDAPEPKSNLQQQAREIAEAMGIIPKMTAEITIAGKPMNRFTSFRIHEESDQHHSFSIVYDHDIQNPESTPLAEMLDMTGERILVSIFPDNIPAATAHIFSGVITRAYKSFDHNPYGSVIVEGYSPTFLLDDKRTKSINSWYKGDIAGIIKELTKPLQPYKTNVTAAPKNIKNVEYICQYKETPFQFMRRIAHDFGEYFFYDGLNLYYGKPQQEEAIKLVYGKDCENLRIGFELKAVNHAHLVYNSSTDKREIKPAPGSIDGLEDFAKKAYDKSRQTFTAPSVMPAPFRASAQSELLEVAVKSHAASEAADMYQISGTSVRQDLKVGAVIDLYTSKVDGGLQVGSEQTGLFILTKVVHTMNAEGKYHNQFEGVPATVPMLPMDDVEYPMAEAQPAIVTSNKDPQGQGRVRVKFYWSQNDKGISDWIKVLTPDAGGSDKVSKNRGFVTIPEEGDLVMVDFRYGQPDQPFITGSMHMGTKSSGGGQGNNLKSLSSKSGHLVQLNDAGGITIKDKSSNVIFIDGTDSITITSSKHITLNSEEITINASKDININAGNAVNITSSPAKDGGGEGTISVFAKKDIDITAAKAFSAEGAVSMELNAGKLDVHGGSKTNISSADTDII